ncbi:MAG: alpha/beta fold hydrolase [Gammaproteobacteria bacterium]|jgi:esterase|nr:alpha/beta fold hydrolase [Gammaproteobacteria bacterium]
MQLFYKQYSTTGKPLIILHGLFGQQGNLTVQAKALAENFKVYGFDARNHGQSAHTDTMSYPEMAEDIIETMDALEIPLADLIGHSMGGKIAMQMALTYPQRVNKLIVVDIAPVNYVSGPNEELSALQKVELSTLTSRKDADATLQTDVPNKAVRDFLLTNLQRNSEGTYQWRMNLSAITKNYSLIKSWGEIGVETKSEFSGETLFIKGGNSNYLLPKYTDKTLAQFPKAIVKIINDAGHWVHNEKPEQFFNIAQEFLLE